MQKNDTVNDQNSCTDNGRGAGLSSSADVDVLKSRQEKRSPHWEQQGG